MVRPVRLKVGMHKLILLVPQARQEETMVVTRNREVGEKAKEVVVVVLQTEVAMETTQMYKGILIKTVQMNSSKGTQG